MTLSISDSEVRQATNMLALVDALDEANREEYAGDIMMLNGRVLHGGGANVTANRARRLIATSWVMNFIVPEEAWPFALSIDEVRAYPPRLQAFLGFHSFSYRGEHPGFLWRVDNRTLEEVLGLTGEDATGQD